MTDGPEWDKKTADLSHLKRDIKEMWNSHPKQIEFLKREDKPMFLSSYTGGASGALTWRMFRRYMAKIKNSREWLVSHRLDLINYLKSKTEHEDWHGVADAAMDLREIDAKLELLDDQGK